MSLKMGYVVRRSVKSHRSGREGDEYGGDRKGKPKTRGLTKNREQIEDRELQLPRKVVVRNLPSHFTQEVFLQHVSPIPEYSYLAFHKADHTLANHTRCRVYIRFRNDDDVATFKEKFDGYVFLDSRGHELRCMVEMAPYQRTAVQQQEKSEPKCGEIFECDEYKRFLEDLEKKKEHTTTSSSARVQASLAAIENKGKDENTLTPLMEFMQNNRMEDEYQRSTAGRFSGTPRKERFRERNSKRTKQLQQKETLRKETAVPAEKTRIITKPKPPPAKMLERENSADLVDSLKDPAILAIKSGVVIARSPQLYAEKPSVKSEDYPAQVRKNIPDPIQGPPDKVIAGTGRGYRDTTDQANAKNPVNRKDDQRPRFGPAAGRGDVPRQETYDRRGGRADNYPPRSAPRQDSFADRPRRGGGEGNFSGRPGPRQEPQGSNRIAESPITGSREFARSKPPVESHLPPEPQDKPMQPQASTDGAPVLVEGAGRVPNRARPTKELYQPKGKRRYQN